MRACVRVYNIVYITTNTGKLKTENAFLCSFCPWHGASHIDS